MRMHQEGFSRKALPAWLLLALGVLASIAASLHLKGSIERDAASRFSFACDQVTLKIRERLQSYELVLRGGAALFETSGWVEREEWRNYVEKLRAESIESGIQGIGFAQFIAPGQLAAHIARVRAEGFPRYTVRPPGVRDEYSAIIYLEPFRDRNLRAFGYDMFSEPVRRAAMERARDSGEAALSGKVTLVQETEAEAQAGTLMYVPAYRKGAAIDTVAQKRAALLGWVYSPYRMNDLMAGILEDWRSREGRHIDLHIHDGTRATDDSRLFDSSALGAALDPRAAFHQQRTIDFHGQQWLLVFGRVSAAPDLDYAPAWWLLAGGLALSGLLFGLMLSLIGTRENANRIARKLTADVHEHERLLGESETRWKFALEGSELGVWDWDIPNGRMFFSKLWKAMLGYADEEIGVGTDEWETRIHPDDLPQVLAKARACQEGKAPYYDMDVRFRCKDGSYKWLRDRGMVISRDAEGKPLRMIGTHSDITERKRLEHEREQFFRFFMLSSEPMVIADPQGRFKQVNPAMVRMIGFSETELMAKPLIEFVHPDDRQRTMEEMRRRMSQRPSPQFENRYVRKDGAAIFLSWDAYFDETDGVTYASARDITESRRAQKRIERLNRFYAALSQCNEAIVRCATQEALFKRICEVVIHFGGMKMVWIGLTDAGSGKVLPVESYGSGTDYLDGILVTVDAADPHGQGPTGTAARENQAVWLDDLMNDPRSMPWRERMEHFGWRASAALPICRDGRPVGALTFYSDEPGLFDEETRKLLDEMAADISFALDKFASEAETKAFQSSLIESEQRFRALVEQSIAGAYIIQDGKLVYVNPRFKQILGYAPEDDLVGLGPDELIAGDDRGEAHERFKRLLAGGLPSTDGLFKALRKDGTTVDVGTNSSLSSYHHRPAVIGLLQDISDRKVAEDQIRRYTARLEKTFMQTVNLATTLSEMRDPYTAGHERRVAEIAVAIGAEMGLDKDRLEGLRVGGYLHDVGKIQVPAEILARPGKLSATEYQLIQGHAQAGYDVLKDVDFPWPVAQIALQHHERIDGSGYPRGLKGEAILLEARITAVADVVESMASHRPYRPGLGIDKAMAEIERGSGSLYDPVAAAACLRLFREKAYSLPE